MIDKPLQTKYVANVYLMNIFEIIIDYIQEIYIESLYAFYILYSVS